jgi:hypothetical protein
MIKIMQSLIFKNSFLKLTELMAIAKIPKKFMINVIKLKIPRNTRMNE